MKKAKHEKMRALLSDLDVNSQAVPPTEADCGFLVFRTSALPCPLVYGLKKAL